MEGGEILEVRQEEQILDATMLPPLHHPNFVLIFCGVCTMFPGQSHFEGYGKHIKHMPECRVSGGRGGEAFGIYVTGNLIFDIKLFIKKLRQFYAISVESQPPVSRKWPKSLKCPFLMILT